MIRLVLLVCAAIPAWSQTFRVMKVKGNKAVIRLPKGITLDKGQTYAIDPRFTDDNRAPSSVRVGSRQRILGLTGEIFTGSQKSGSSSSGVTTVDFNVRYGWNNGKLEYGPLAGFDYSSIGSLSTRAFSFGGFLDYNLVPNTDVNSFVYGPGGSASIGSVSQEVLNTTVSGSRISIGAGFQAKWFMFPHSTCFRGDAQLLYVRNSFDSTTATDTGLYLAAGLQTYF